MNERDVQGNCPIMVVRDSESEGALAAVCRRNGGGEYVVREIAHITARLGYMRIVIKTDQEYTINEVDARFDATKNSIAQDTNGASESSIVIVGSPGAERQSNGRIENAIRRVQEQATARAVK